MTESTSGADGSAPIENQASSAAVPATAADASSTNAASSANTAEGTPAGGADASAESAGGSSAITADQAKIALRRVKDPELNLNIVDLGLVYDVTVDGSVVKVDMSLTSPGCPSGPEIMGEAEQQLRTIPGVSDVVMNLVWTPPWTPERIEPRVRAYMGF